jgi:hypothetical protein
MCRPLPGSRHAGVDDFASTPTPISCSASLSGCEPFKFTAGFAGVIAGRPIMINHVDNRDLEKQSGAR